MESIIYRIQRSWGQNGKMSIDKYVDKKFIKSNGRVTGYITGIQLANMYGFTTQTPACIEVCSNEATTKQRKLCIDGRNLIVYKPITEIAKENQTALQFLDLMTTIDKYSEISGNFIENETKRIRKYPKCGFFYCKKIHCVIPGSGVPEYLSRRTDG